MYIIFKPSDSSLHQEYISQNLSFHATGAVEISAGKGIVAVYAKKNKRKRTK